MGKNHFQLNDCRSTGVCEWIRSRLRVWMHWLYAVERRLHSVRIELKAPEHLLAQCKCARLLCWRDERNGAHTAELACACGISGFSQLSRARSANPKHRTVFGVCWLAFRQPQIRFNSKFSINLILIH